MSVCTFLAADCPLEPVCPSQDYPLHIDLDRGVIEDGGADDNFYLQPFPDPLHYTAKRYGVSLEWPQYTPGRARRVMDYIREVLTRTDRVELWTVWLSDYDPPVIRRAVVPVDELTPEDIRELADAEIWNNPDRYRPTYYCLEITR